MAKSQVLRYFEVNNYGNRYYGWKMAIYNLINYIIAELPLGWTYANVNNPVPVNDSSTPGTRRIDITYDGMTIIHNFSWDAQQCKYIDNGATINYITVDGNGVVVEDYKIFKYETANGFVIAFSPAKYALINAAGRSMFKIKLINDSYSFPDTVFISGMSFYSFNILDINSISMFGGSARYSYVGKSKESVPSVSNVAAMANNGFYCGYIYDCIYSDLFPGFEISDGVNNYVMLEDAVSYPIARIAFKY